MKKKLLIALLLIVVVVGAVWIISSANQSKARDALADYKAKLRAQGEKLTFTELGYPFPLETNSNLENFTALADRLSARSQIPSLIEFMPYESPGRAVVIWSGGRLKPPLPKALDPDYPRWSELAEDLKSVEDLLAEIRVELEHPPRYFGWNHTNPFASNQPRSPFVQKRKAAQFLAADCLAALHERQLDRAQTNLHALTQLAQVHRDDLPLVSGMIRVAVASLGLNMTWHALQADGWDESSLAKVQREWEAVDLISSMENGFAGERCAGQAAFALFHSGDVDSQDRLLSAYTSAQTGRSSQSGIAGLKNQVHGKFAQAIWRGHMDEDELFYLQDSQARLETLRKLKTNTSAALLRIEMKEQHDSVVREFDKPFGRTRHLFSASWIPSFNRAFDVSVQRETERRMTITAIALKRFQLRNGRYPASLAELAPQFLAGELMDPWSGKPFHYRVETDGTFTLYSVGMDGRDDGGDPTPEKSSKNPTDMWSGKDAVWPKPVWPAGK